MPKKNKSFKELEPVRTTVHLDFKTHQNAKIHCIKKGIYFKEYVTNLIVKDLKKGV